MHKKHILIIGGGACGVASFIHLVQELIIGGHHDDVKITLCEKGDTIGEGLAFGTRQPGHLLNTPASLMGIYSNEPGHYGDWLEANRHAVKEEEIKSYDDPEDAYTTRRLYSLYIQEAFHHYLSRAEEHGLEVACVHDEVVNILQDHKGYDMIFQKDNPIRSDYVILAPGTPKPDNYSEFRSLDEYIDFPWPSGKLLRIPAHATVGILGTSLSAIDAVMTLVDNQHQGVIKLFSPDGLLPRVQPNKMISYSCKYFTLAMAHAIRREHFRGPKISELFRLFKQEVAEYNGEDIDWKSSGRRNKSPEFLLDEDIKIAVSGGDAFIKILDAFRYDATPVWSLLSTQEKMNFKKWIGPEWNVTRHAMPLHNARRLQKLFSNKKLEVSGGFEDVRYDVDSRKFIAEWRNGNEEVHYLINATGPANTVDEMRSTLIQNLSSSGTIVPHEVGGIVIDPHTMQVVSSSGTAGRLYAVGHICNGLLMDVNAVWFNVKTIGVMIQHVVGTLGKR